MRRPVRKNTTIVFIGDSITDCGRMGGCAPLGDGYVKLVVDFLAIRKPGRRFQVINKGVGGQTLVELQERWTDDVLRKHPDILVMMIGINDCCRTVVKAATAVPPDRYARLYDEVMRRTMAALPACRIVLLEPFYITRETAASSIRHTVLKQLAPYRRTAARMARQYRARWVPLHAVFQRLLKHHEPDVFCAEPVHPNRTGHLVIAEAVYRALDAVLATKRG